MTFTGVQAEWTRMEVKLTDQDKYVVVKLSGSLDIYTSLDLKAALENQSESFADIEDPAPWPKTLVIDLGEVTYIDSSGIGALIKIYNRTEQIQARFVLANLRPIIEKVFKVAGLITYFEVIDDATLSREYPV